VDIEVGVVTPVRTWYRLFTRAWDELEQRYGSFYLDGPYSSTMAAFIRRRGIEPDRHDPLD
jgi:hypothetical protein